MRAGATETPTLLLRLGCCAAIWHTFGHFLEDVTRHSGTNSDATSYIFIDLFWLLLLLFLLCRAVVLIANCFASLPFVCHQLIFIYTYFQLNIIKLTLRARANSASLGRAFCVVSFRYSPPPAQRRAQPGVKSRRYVYIYIIIVASFAISLFSLLYSRFSLLCSAYIPHTPYESCPQLSRGLVFPFHNMA